MEATVGVWPVGGWPTFLFAAIVLFLLKPLWWDGEILAFRDSLHFYYPLWHYIDSLPFVERILPLFNPLDAFGSSVVGEPTSMVFYPAVFAPPSRGKS